MKKNRKVIVLLLVVIVSMFLSGCNLTLGYTTIPESSNDYPSILCKDEYITITSPHNATVVFQYTAELGGQQLTFIKSVDFNDFKGGTTTFPRESLFDNVIEDTDSVVITSATIVSSTYLSLFTVFLWIVIAVIVIIVIILVICGLMSFL